MQLDFDQTDGKYIYIILSKKYTVHITCTGIYD